MIVRTPLGISSTYTPGQVSALAIIVRLIFEMLWFQAEAFRSASKSQGCLVGTISLALQSALIVTFNLQWQPSIVNLSAE